MKKTLKVIVWTWMNIENGNLLAASALLGIVLVVIRNIWF